MNLYEKAIVDMCLKANIPMQDKSPNEIITELISYHRKDALDPNSPEYMQIEASAYNQGIEEHSKFCSQVHTEPLIDAVIEAGLSESETEGPCGNGGIDHAHTIRYLGKISKKAPRLDLKKVE